MACARMAIMSGGASPGKSAMDSISAALKAPPAAAPSTSRSTGPPGNSSGTSRRSRQYMSTSRCRSATWLAEDSVSCTSDQSSPLPFSSTAHPWTRDLPPSAGTMR